MFMFVMLTDIEVLGHPFCEGLSAKGKSKFSFRLTKWLKSKGLDFERGDHMMMNYTKETD